MLDDVLSIVTDAPVSYLIYSALSFYGERRGREIAGTWFVAALEALGVAPAATRQTLFRMERDEELESRRVGRAKWYMASPYARAEMGAGLQKIFAGPGQKWDGYWTLVLTQFPTDMRVERERVRSILQVEGFAPLGNGAYVHAHDRAARLREALSALGASKYVTAFRVDHVHGVSDRAFARSHWDLDSLATEYAAFLRRFVPLARRRARDFPLSAQFGLRFAVVLGFLEVAWKDPELPRSMLPASWPGHRARAVARRLYERYLPGALAFGDALAKTASRDTITAAREVPRREDRPHLTTTAPRARSGRGRRTSTAPRA